MNEALAEAIVKTLVGIRAMGQPVGHGRYRCDFEGCPGHTARAKKVLIWSPRYLFVHRACLPAARRAARQRGEAFGYRRGL